MPLSAWDGCIWWTLSPYRTASSVPARAKPPVIGTGLHVVLDTNALSGCLALAETLGRNTAWQAEQSMCSASFFCCLKAGLSRPASCVVRHPTVTAASQLCPTTSLLSGSVTGNLHGMSVAPGVAEPLT
jgi:hypothetical protein